MKLKFAIASLGLAAILGIGAGAGLKAQKAETAKATGEEYMFRIGINMKVASTWTGDGQISNLRFHFWGKDGDDDYNDTVALSLQNGSANYGYQESGFEDVYGTNVVLSTSKTVTGGCFILDQATGPNRYSQDLEISFSATGDEFVREYHYVTWEGEKWTAAHTYSSTCPALKPDGAPANFTANPAKHRWELLNYEYTSGYFHFMIAEDYATSVVSADSSSLVSGADANACWMNFKDAGTYDLYLYGNPVGTGHMVIQKHGATSSSYVYYVTGENTATVNYVYTYGGVEQFGIWPGTQITSVPGVSEVTGGGVLHFNGENVRIYRIPLKAGYDGDTRLIINYQGEPKAQSSDKQIVIGAGFKWADSEMTYAMGAALDLLSSAEDARNAVTASGKIKAYSVCGINATKSEELADDYNALSSEAQAYINNSSVYTYRRDGGDGEEMVSYRAIFEQLAAQGNVTLDESRPLAMLNNADTIIVVIIVSSVALIAAAGFFFIRRKQENK